jgi:CHAD domain-containing protein
MDKPEKTIEVINRIMSDLNLLKFDAAKFDRGNDLAGLRLRKNLNTIKSRIEHLRKEIQRVRYYRDAWSAYFGERKYIDGLAYKEKKYGTVPEVAMLQFLQKWKA